MGGRGVGFIGFCLVACAGVAVAPAGAATFTSNEALKSTSQTNDGGALLPYPAQMNVQGTTGTVTGARATLRDIAYVDVDELSALLVAPDGRTVLLMHRPCNGQNTTAGPITFTFDDQGAPLPGTPTCTTATYRPTIVVGGGTSLVYPAPQPPYPLAMASLAGVQPNGIWKLFVWDNIAAAGGEVGGWSLDLTTTAAPSTPAKKKCKKHKKRSASTAKKRCKKKR